MNAVAEAVKTLPEGFRYTDRGAIEYRYARKDGEDERWEWLCSPLEILAETRDADEKGWGLLVRIKARGGAGIWHTQIVTQALCIAEGGELFALLASLGLEDHAGQGRQRPLAGAALPCEPRQACSRCLAHRLAWRANLRAAGRSLRRAERRAHRVSARAPGTAQLQAQGHVRGLAQRSGGAGNRQLAAGFRPFRCLRRAALAAAQYRRRRLPSSRR